LIPHSLRLPFFASPVVNGAAGNIEGLGSLGSPLPPYVVWANDTLFGFSLFTFQDKNHLQVQFISSHDGSVLDSAVLYKQH
jgi:hypothetical protein